MAEIRKIVSIAQVDELKQQYLQKTTAALDGMWLRGFVPRASHFGFYENEELVGYCCINDDGYVLQLYVCQEFQDQAGLLFEELLVHKHQVVPEVNGAFVSTAEPGYLALCLDLFPRFKVHTFMYQLGSFQSEDQINTAPLQLTTLTHNQLAEAVAFAKLNVGAHEGWLMGYYSALINRGELFGLLQNGRFVAAGESRSDDHVQSGYGDIGLIVDRALRGQGIGTQIMTELVRITQGKGLKPICSTEKENIAAQKAITRAGFFAGHRIIQFDC
ncbi:GNAT family N-acetyltransferase [Desulforhopalus sp. 52FAK]